MIDSGRYERNPMLITAIVAYSMLQPAYDLTDNTLTVSGAEVVAVRGGDLTLLEGVALIDDGLAWGDQLVWELAPGTYAVTALGPEINGVRDQVAWEIVLEGPPPPTRAEQIRSAVLRFFQASADLRALAPTDVEIFAAIRGD